MRSGTLNVSFYLRTCVGSFFGQVGPFLTPVVVALITLVLFRIIFVLKCIPDSSVRPALRTKDLVLKLEVRNRLRGRSIVVFERSNACVVGHVTTVRNSIVLRGNRARAIPTNYFCMLKSGRSGSRSSQC